MNLVMREPTGDDATGLARILFDAFDAIAEQHRFPPDCPAPETAAGLVGGLLEHPGFYGIVAELDGRVVGSNFLDERSHITGLGPITVDPAVQNRAVWRQLMEHMLTRVRTDGRPGVRLLQATYHTVAMPLHQAGVRHPGVAVERPGAAAEPHDSQLRRASSNDR